MGILRGTDEQPSQALSNQAVEAGGRAKIAGAVEFETTLANSLLSRPYSNAADAVTVLRARDTALLLDKREGWPGGHARCAFRG